MSQYSATDVNNVTIDDALNDTDWNRKPREFVKYIGVPMSVLQAIVEDFSKDESYRFIDVLALYYVTGLEPAYDTISSSGVKMALRETIASADERMNSEYVRHYRQHIKAVLKNETNTTNGT